MTDSIYVHVIDFPNTKCREVVTANADGSYSVFLNAKQSCHVQECSYRHALDHIKDNNFECYDVQDIERIAHA